MSEPGPPPSDQPPVGGYGPPPSYGPPPRTEEPLWAILAHLSIFVFGIVAPLAIYLVFKDTQPFTRQHAAEALNFHLTLLIATIVSAILVIVLIGFVLLVALAIAAVVLTIIAAVAAGNRQPYRYPLTIHFVS